MTPASIDLVKTSYALVMPIQEQAAQLFYGRLFEIAPETKNMFKGDMKEQGRKLMMTIATVVGSLDQLDKVLPAVKALAVKHVGYRVEDSHFDTVGEALLWTLQAGLGDAFTPAHKAAWTETYVLLATVMREAMADSTRRSVQLQ